MRYFVIFLMLCTISSTAQEGAGRYTFVFLNTNPDRPELPQAQVDSLQAGHLANISRLAKEQKLISAGPFYTGGGIFIFDTNLEDTEAVLNSDPAVAAGRFKIETIPFNMDMGKICTLWHLAEDEYEMTTYLFMRLKNKFISDEVYAMKTNRVTLDKLKEAEQKMPEFEVLGDLNFDGNQGQVVIFKGDEDKIGQYVQFFSGHKGVKSGDMELYIKKLYLAKGVFCEK